MTSQTEMVETPTARFLRYLDTTLRKLRELEDIVKQTPNTKKEVKAGLETLQGVVKKLYPAAKLALNPGKKDAVSQVDLLESGPAKETKCVSTDTPCWWPAAAQNNTGEKWSEVVSKKRRNSIKTTPLEPKAVAKAAIVKTRTLPAAIIVRTGVAGYSECLKRMRNGEATKAKAQCIKNIRKTASGDLLVQLEKATDKETVKQAVAETMGEDVIVSSVTQTVKVVIGDLDELVTKEEVKEAVSDSVGDVEAEVLHLLKAARGQVLAVVQLSLAGGKRLLEAGRLRVGFTSARTRVWEDRKRCFRCHGSGHLAATCKGADRTKACFRCGADGHVSVMCKASEDVRRCFRAQLAVEAKQ